MTLFTKDKMPKPKLEDRKDIPVPTPPPKPEPVQVVNEESIQQYNMDDLVVAIQKHHDIVTVNQQVIMDELEKLRLKIDLYEIKQEEKKKRKSKSSKK